MCDELFGRLRWTTLTDEVRLNEFHTLEPASHDDFAECSGDFEDDLSSDV